MKKGKKKTKEPQTDSAPDQEPHRRNSQRPIPTQRSEPKRTIRNNQQTKKIYSINNIIITSLTEDECSSLKYPARKPRNSIRDPNGRAVKENQMQLEPSTPPNFRNKTKLTPQIPPSRGQGDNLRQIWSRAPESQFWTTMRPENRILLARPHEERRQCRGRDEI